MLVHLPLFASGALGQYQILSANLVYICQVQYLWLCQWVSVIFHSPVHDGLAFMHISLSLKQGSIVLG